MGSAVVRLVILSDSAGSTRTSTPPWPLAAIAMLPPTRKAMPPNIFFSLTPRSAERSSRIRWASSSSYATWRTLLDRCLLVEAERDGEGHGRDAAGPGQRQPDGVRRCTSLEQLAHRGHGDAERLVARERLQPARQVTCRDDGVAREEKEEGRQRSGVRRGLRVFGQDPDRRVQPTQGVPEGNDHGETEEDPAGVAVKAKAHRQADRNHDRKSGGASDEVG